MIGAGLLAAMDAAGRAARQRVIDERMTSVVRSAESARAATFPTAERLPALIVAPPEPVAPPAA